MIIELNMALVIFSVALAAIGLAFDKSMFTFISGILFLLIGLTTEELIFMIPMIGLAIWQMFSSFFEFRRG